MIRPGLSVRGQRKSSLPPGLNASREETPVHKIGGLMEVILHVQDMVVQVSFYRDILALDVSSTAAPPAHTLHCTSALLPSRLATHHLPASCLLPRTS